MSESERRESRTCECCGRSTSHPVDILQGWCSNCDAYTPAQGVDPANCELCRRPIPLAELEQLVVPPVEGLRWQGVRSRLSSRQVVLVCRNYRGACAIGYAAEQLRLDTIAGISGGHL